MKRLLQILIINVLLLIPQPGHSQVVNESFSTSSVLAEGQWFKIAFTKEGIYRIDYSMFKQLGLTNPSDPKIFGNNSGQLSYYNDDPKPDDLKEIPTLKVKGSDGIFNEGDYLLFYGKGTNQWKYNSVSGDYDFNRHNYSDTAFYFITSGADSGKTVISVRDTLVPPNYYSASYDALFIHEIEDVNLIKSGREWYQPVSTLSGITINPGFSDIITSEKINYSIRVLARSSIPALFRLYEGANILEGILVPEVNLFNYTGMYARIAEVTGSAYSASSSPVWEMKFYNNGEQGALGWIDYIKLHGRALTTIAGSTIIFSDSRSVKSGGITEFTVKSQTEGVNIWDVTDPFNPNSVQYTKTGDLLKFIKSTNKIRTFIVFTNDKVLRPVIKATPVPNQNLHASQSADMVIVTHPLFLAYANKIAEIHNENTGLVSQVVTPEQIYNEFSGGIPDIAAIRNFLRMKYKKQNGSSHPLRYLLLFGDGSYENKTPPPHNPNFIPTYQSQNSNIIVSSFTSDDFYGLLDNGEGEADGTEDLGIGRLPASDTTQAGNMVSKIVRYLSTRSMGDWRNVICITADDEDGNAYMNDAEGLSSLLDTRYPAYNIDKIYLDAFRQVTSVSGQSYPDVNKAINNRINAGCLIFNYLGHGSETGLTGERVLKTDDINNWKNTYRLPLFITATCEFGRFDDMELNSSTREMTGKNSAGEMVLLNRDGGGIALMTTTRVVYSAPNYTLNRSIYNYAFTRDPYGNALGLGDIIRLAKLNSGTSMNKRNFLLLGDPAVRLAYPSYGQIKTDSVNKASVTDRIDSLKALSMMTVSGHIEDNNGNLMNDFSGTVYPLVYDKATKVKTLSNDGGQTMEFNLVNNIVFSGKTKASKGQFSFTFLVPKDIDYSYGPGKFSYYASQGNTDMGGAFTNFIIGGFSNSSSSDTEGPNIKLFLNDTLFRYGGITDSNPVLLAIIEDKGGINTTGSGIGHDLTAFLDNERNNSFVLNNYFENDLDNYKKGRIIYPVGKIEAGTHTMTLKAWDNFNNSTEKSIAFLVKTDRGFILNNLLNYPNPVIDQTNISAEHNRPDANLNVVINIYNLSGKIIRIIRTSFQSTGYKLPPILWDGNEEGGKRAGRGIYPYSVIVSTEKGEVTRASGRMIIL
jgi:hypothetical protein